MHLEQQNVHNGDRVTFPNVGDRVGVHYTGWLHDVREANGKGLVGYSGS